MVDAFLAAKDKHAHDLGSSAKIRIRYWLSRGGDNSMKPSQIPANYVQNERGEYCHPSRVTQPDNSVGAMVKRADEGKPMLALPQSKRIRQSSKPLMNKLETEIYAHLCALYPECSFHAQSVRFKLGNGIHYKPDVVCFRWRGIVCCWEVKGPFAFRGGFENLKVAAHAYPEIQWVLVWKENDRWCEQVVLA